MRKPHAPRPLFLILTLILATASILLLLGGAPAQEAQPAAASGVPDPDEQPVAVYLPTGADPATRPAARFAADLAAAREDFKRDLQALTTRYHAAHGHEQRETIQREIKELKRGIDLRILVIQRDHAREQGHVEAAEAIDARLEVLAARGVTPAEPLRPQEGGDRHED